MREVEVSRFVRATLPEVERLLTPDLLIEYEGTFTVRGVSETDDGVVVDARASGMGAEFRFEEREDGFVYRQQGSTGPFDEMETTVSAQPEDEGTRVTMRSAVSLGLPVASLTDRIAAWKRKGELKRALENLAADVE